MKLGIISDTHGLLRPQALAALRGSDLILHAGDIGSQAVLDALAQIANVTAIRGNNDEVPWASHIPASVRLELEATTIHMLHDLKELALDPVQEAIDVVIAGHSHRPSIERRQGVLYLNPGSAGPRRFKLPVSIATLTLGRGAPRARIVELKIPPN